MPCPSCGAVPPPDARFCPGCGAGLADLAPERARDADRAEGDEREETRLLTLLFVDTSGSVAATYDLDPETAARRLNEILGVMFEEIESSEGRVNKVLGDGVLAFFGLPRSREDDPERAIRSALEVRRRARGLGFDVTAGIDTGVVFLGGLGSDDPRDHSAAGRAVNMAARFQASARPGQVLVGESTYRLTRGIFEFVPRRLEVKGVSEPVVAHEVVRELPEGSKVRGIEGLRAPLVGRAGELERMMRALEDVVQGGQRIVSVLGEAGVGKSRLVSEYRQSVAGAYGEDRPPLWLEGRCRESAASTGYHPFVDLFRGYFAWGSEEGREARRGRVAERIHAMAEDGLIPTERVNDMLPFLERLLLVERRTEAGDPHEDTTPERIKSGTFLAIRDFFGAMARKRPVVIVLEDLHWADTLSADLVTFLIDELADSRVLLVCVLRPDDERRSRDLTRIARRKAPERHVAIELRELTPEEGEVLLRALLAVERLPSAAAGTILEKAQGNPFFLEEVVRSLIDAGEIIRENGGWRVDPSVESIEVPPTIQSVILSRIDLLEDDSKRVLRAASIMGRLFDPRLLAAALGDEVDLETLLPDLERHDLVFLDRVVPEEEYAFRHTFVRDTVYRSLLQEQRRSLHRKVAEAIERSYPDRLEEHYEELANHYDRAGEPRKALEFQIAAGEKARRGFSNEEAIRHFRAALESLERLSSEEIPADRRRETGATILETLGDVLDLTGRHEAALDAYARALAERTEGERAARARILRKRATVFRLQRRVDEAEGEHERAVAALGEEPGAAEPEWWRERIEIGVERLWRIYFTASSEELSEAREEIGPWIERHGTPLQRARFFYLLGLVEHRETRYAGSEAAISYARRALAAIEETGNRHDIGDTRFGLGFAYLWARRLEPAVEHMERALDEARRLGDVTLQSRCTAYLGLAHRMRGDIEGARRYADECREIARKGGMEEYLAAADAHSAWVALREGRPEEAGQLGQAALERWRTLPGPYVVLRWIAIWPLLGAAWGRGEKEEALAYAHQLLDPALRPPPPALREALEAAVQADEAGDPDVVERLDEVVERARREGYL